MRLGPYQIIDSLGAGGMGEVYRGTDTRLGRDVAIKVLPIATMASADAIARFEREGRAIAALNHPNICTLFDVGTDAGRPYLVMELLSGASLHQVAHPIAAGDGLCVRSRCGGRAPEIEAAGGKRTADPMSAPGMGTFGYFTDPSGTHMGPIGP
jgi:hypothetical protein